MLADVSFWQAAARAMYFSPTSSLSGQRFYWLACTIVGYHNPTWSSARIIKDINWITGLPNVGTRPEGLRKWFKWVLGTHRIGQHEHMKPEYRHRLPEIEAHYQ